MPAAVPGRQKVRTSQKDEEEEETGEAGETWGKMGDTSATRGGGKECMVVIVAAAAAAVVLPLLLLLPFATAAFAILFFVTHSSCSLPFKM